MTTLRPTAPASMEERQQRLIDDFLLFDDWAERYQHLIDLGALLPPMPRALRTARNRMPVCGGETYMAGERRGERLFLHAESDMPVPAGILAVMLTLYSGARMADILRHPPRLFDRIGLTHRLSPHRRIALLNAHERIVALASDYDTAGKIAS